MVICQVLCSLFVILPKKILILLTIITYRDIIITGGDLDDWK